jgi:septation ring formation regulator EzrA
MPTSVEQVIEHIKKDIATLEAHARQAEELLPHVAEKYAARWKAAIEARWQQAKELSALLQEIQKDHPGN